jgi:hypothetical protein
MLTREKMRRAEAVERRLGTTLNEMRLWRVVWLEYKWAQGREGQALEKEEGMSIKAETLESVQAPNDCVEPECQRVGLRRRTSLDTGSECQRDDIHKMKDEKRTRKGRGRTVVSETMMNGER